MIGALIDHLWQSTLFCGGVWLLTFGLRANSAALRHWLWLLASLKFLVPFSAAVYVGAMAGLPPPVAVQPDFFGERSASPCSSSPTALRCGHIAGAPGFGCELVLLAAWLGRRTIVALRWLIAWRAADSISRAARPAPGASPDARITDADIEPAVARVFHPVVLLPAALLGRLHAPRRSKAVLAHEREHIARHDNLKDEHASPGRNAVLVPSARSGG